MAVMRVRRDGGGRKGRGEEEERGRDREKFIAQDRDSVEGEGGDSLRVRRWRVRGEMGSHCIPARAGEGRRSSCLRYQ